MSRESVAFVSIRYNFRAVWVHTHAHSACKICIQITYVSDRDAVIFQNYIQSKKAKNMYIILIRKTETFYWMNLRHLRHGRCHLFAFSVSFLPCDSYLTISRSTTVNPKQMSNQQQRYGDLWRIKYSRSRERDWNVRLSSFVSPISHNSS